MKRNGVKSTTLLSIGYNVDREKLELDFTSGKVYQTWMFHILITHY